MSLPRDRAGGARNNALRIAAGIDRKVDARTAVAGLRSKGAIVHPAPGGYRAPLRPGMAALVLVADVGVGEVRVNLRG